MITHYDIERSIIKKFRKDIWVKFIKAIKTYNLIEENDKIAVCISGGKDSMLLAKCMEKLQKHSKIIFNLKFIIMDPGYSNITLNKIKENLNLLNINGKIFNSNIFNIVKSIGTAPCYLCARMRRGHLYNEAKKIGCNKIALGHHYDDIIETILLSIFYSGEIKTMMPKLHSTNFSNMELIRPLYFIREKSIIDWKNYNNLNFIDCGCVLDSYKKERNIGKSKREEIKELIKYFNNLSPVIEQNIFKSVENININSIIGYKKDNKKYNFLESYKFNNKL